MYYIKIKMYNDSLVVKKFDSFAECFNWCKKLNSSVLDSYHHIVCFDSLILFEIQKGGEISV